MSDTNTEFKNAYDMLNPAQKEAVDTIEGPVMVVAGPGTGKTQVLATRIANILQKTQVNPYNILAITFTESAALNMRRRLLGMIGTAAYHVRIATFHGFCNDLIQEFPEKFLFSRNLIMLDDLNRVKVIQETIDEVKPEILTTFTDPYYYQTSILDAIRKLKQEHVSTEDLEAMIGEEQQEFDAEEDKINPRTGKMKRKWVDAEKNIKKHRDLLALFREYTARCTTYGFYDYEDMILFVLQKLQEDEQLLATLRERYLYILVDEYQDTNGAQNAIVSLLGSFDRKPNLFVVGDDDQAIYRFQGASLENILYFNETFDTHKVTLTTNYRSTQEVIDAASSMISHNNQRLKKEDEEGGNRLRAHSTVTGAIPEHHEFYSPHEEYEFVAQKIKDLRAKHVPLSEISILYRRHRDANGIIETLHKHDIPFYIHAEDDILMNIKIQQLIALLKLIRKPHDNHTLFKVLLFDFMNIPRIEAYRLLRYRNPENKALFDMLDNTEALEELGIQDIEGLGAFKQQILEWFGAKENLALIQLVERVMQESGFLDTVVASDDVKELNQVKTFFEFIRHRNEFDVKMSLKDLLDDISLLEENRLRMTEDPIHIEKEAVNLMTVHKAKGLEFAYVFIIHGYDENWAGFKSRNLIKLPSGMLKTVESEDIEDEERRLFFVAMTRAKEGLCITNSSFYTTQYAVKQVVPARFLEEIDNDYITHTEHTQSEEDAGDTLSAFFAAYKEKPYSYEEEEFLRAVIEKYALSVTGLNTYLTCPRKFKYQNLLRVPRTLEGEEDQEKILYLGTSVHAALEEFYRELKAGSNPGIEVLHHSFEESLRTLLIGTQAFEDTLEEGKSILADYYQYYKETLIVPAELEYSFNNVFMDDIALTGKVDKIEFVDPQEKTVKVIDYKTSKPKSKNAIMGETAYSDGSLYRQLTFYKLLSMLDKRFTYKYANVVECELDFVKPNDSGKFKKEAFTIGSEAVETLKAEIETVMGRVRNLEFPKTQDLNICKKCPYEKICWGKRLS